MDSIDPAGRPKKNGGQSRGKVLESSNYEIFLDALRDANPKAVTECSMCELGLPGLRLAAVHFDPVELNPGGHDYLGCYVLRCECIYSVNKQVQQLV